MDEITENTLDNEVFKHFKKWVAMNRVRLLIILVFVITGNVALFLFYWFIVGKEIAYQYLFESLVALVVFNGLGGVGSYLYVAWYKIPSEIFEQQRKIIIERLPDELYLDIERTPNFLRRDGQEFQAAALHITNLEKKKIVEFQALINFHHFYCRKDRDFVGETDYEYNAPLYWIGTEPAETEIELRPDTGKVVLICELTKAKTGDGKDISVALMGCNPTPTSVDFADESIYQVKILFQGKLEGEYNFRTFYYKDVLYTKPEDQRILFLDEAEEAYPDIPSRLIERSKNVIEFMDNKK